MALYLFVERTLPFRVRQIPNLRRTFIIHQQRTGRQRASFNRLGSGLTYLAQNHVCQARPLQEQSCVSCCHSPAASWIHLQEGTQSQKYNPLDINHGCNILHVPNSFGPQESNKSNIGNECSCKKKNTKKMLGMWELQAFITRLTNKTKAPFSVVEQHQ